MKTDVSRAVLNWLLEVIVHMFRLILNINNNSQSVHCFAAESLYACDVTV